MRRRRIAIHGTQAALAVAFVLGWQIFAGTPGDDRFVIIDEYYVSTPLEIVETLSTWISNGELMMNTLVTVRTLALGLVAGISLGMVIGFVFGASKSIATVLLPFVSAAYGIPRLALVPLFLLWFGLGLLSQLMFVITIVFFLVFFNTYSGIKDVDRDVTDTLRVMGATRSQIHRKVTLPSALTWIIAGLRLSAPYALVATVTAEMLSTSSGLGYLLVRSTNQFYTAGAFAALVAMAGLALCVNGAVTVVERRLLRWKTRGPS